MNSTNQQFNEARMIATRGGARRSRRFNSQSSSGTGIFCAASFWTAKRAEARAPLPSCARLNSDARTLGWNFDQIETEPRVWSRGGGRGDRRRVSPSAGVLGAAGQAGKCLDKLGIRLDVRPLRLKQSHSQAREKRVIRSLTHPAGFSATGKLAEQPNVPAPCRATLMLLTPVKLMQIQSPRKTLTASLVKKTIRQLESQSI